MFPDDFFNGDFFNHDFWPDAAGIALPPDFPGLEYTIPNNVFHYTIPDEDR